MRSSDRCPSSDSAGITTPALSRTPAVAPAIISRSAPKQRREMRRDRVGVDVEERALARHADARYDRDAADPKQVGQQRRVGAIGLTRPDRDRPSDR